MPPGAELLNRFEGDAGQDEELRPCSPMNKLNAFSIFNKAEMNE